MTIRFLDERIELKPINTYCHCCGRDDVPVSYFEWLDAKYVGCNECISKMMQGFRQADFYAFRMETFEDDEDAELIKEVQE